MNLLSNPLTYFMLALALAAWVWRDKLMMGRAGFTAAAMFVVSTFLITLYHYGNGLDQQIALWQGGLVIDGLIYVAILAWFGARPAWLFLAGAAVIGFYAGALGSAGMTQKWFWFFQISAIAAMAWGCYLTVKKDDITGQLFWAVLAIGEFFSAAQVLDCQMLHDIPAQEGSACAQAYDWIAAPYATVAPLSLIWAYLIYRWVMASDR